MPGERVRESDVRAVTSALRSRLAYVTGLVPPPAGPDGQEAKAEAEPRVRVLEE